MSQIIAVTAGKGGTGKSTTSANVATALAALGKKTLVVELDFGLRCLDIIKLISLQPQLKWTVLTTSIWSARQGIRL